MISPQSAQKIQLLRLLTAIFVLAIALASAVPHYLTGQWVWSRPPLVENLEQVKALQTQGLTIPNWQNLSHDVIRMGGHRWSVQQFATTPAPASDTPPSRHEPVLLMLRPQLADTDQPQIDWVNIGSEFGWTADNERWIEFSVPSLSGGNASVQARFLRYWDAEQTYAAMQWYAWPARGSASPNRWFWADQASQWRDRRRTPWVAVSVLIPIEPLGDLETNRAIAQSVGQTVQSTLLAAMLPSEPRLSP